MQIMENRIKMGGLVIIARPFIFREDVEVTKVDFAGLGLYNYGITKFLNKLTILFKY